MALLKFIMAAAGAAYKTKYNESTIFIKRLEFNAFRPSWIGRLHRHSGLCNPEDIPRSSSGFPIVSSRYKYRLLWHEWLCHTYKETQHKYLRGHRIRRNNIKITIWKIINTT